MIIDIQHASLKFKEKTILSHINLKIEEHDFIVLLGTNGSGKSSLLKLIDGQYSAHSGKIHYKIDLKTIKTLTQNTHDSLFTSLTLFENYRLFKQCPNTLLERKVFKKYMSAFNHKCAENPDELALHLSGGEKQAFALALILIHPPKILLLDEHTAALDPKTSKHVMKLTKKMAEKYHITCILTTHDLEEAITYGDKIIALKEGKIFQTFQNNPELSIQQLFESCF